MASKGLFFAQGLLEGASEKKTKEEERQQKIQDEIRKMQLKALGTNIETYQKRRDAAKQVKSHMDNGNYPLAMATMMKADGDITDWEYLQKNYEGFMDSNDRNKEALNAWLKDVDSAPEPTWEDDVGKIHAASANRNRAAVSLYERFFGVNSDDTVISASHGDHVSAPPAPEDTPEPGTETAKGFEFRPKTEEPKMGFYTDTVTLKSGEQVPRVTAYTQTNQPIITGIATGASKGPAKAAGAVNEVDRQQINGMISSYVDEYKGLGDEATANMLDHGLGGKTGKTGRFGGIQSTWKDIANELRKDPSISAPQAYEIATKEILEMWKLGFIKEQENFMGWGKSDYSIMSFSEKKEQLKKLVKQGMSVEEATRIAKKYQLR